jgi:uncharacterized protein YxeA
MKKQLLIRMMMLVIIITAAFFVVSAARTAKLAQKEECVQGESECTDTKSQSEFLLESLTRNLLGR